MPPVQNTPAAMQQLKLDPKSRWDPLQFEIRRSLSPSSRRYVGCVLGQVEMACFAQYQRFRKRYRHAANVHLLLGITSVV
jgi:hypothetical protein